MVLGMRMECIGCDCCSFGKVGVGEVGVGIEVD